MSESRIDIIARAIKEETDKFESPVRFYIQPEADGRWENENPNADWSDRPDFDELESYRIIARAVDAALNKSPPQPQ